MNNKLIPPCKDCHERSARCHISCGAYKDYQRKNESAREKRWKNTETASFANEASAAVYKIWARKRWRR